MGISADIIIIKNRKYDSVDSYLSEEDPFIALDQLSHLNITSIDLKLPIRAKEICDVGGGHCFKENVLEHYDTNEGIFHLKEGIEYLKDEYVTETITYLEEYFKTDIKYIYELDNVLLTLNY
jgi:hypothetical protein